MPDVYRAWQRASYCGAQMLKELKLENHFTDWLTLLLMVFGLGVKHGMDPDHLATIDSITRFNFAKKINLAQHSGILFSLGHGLVVITLAAIAGISANHWEFPKWLENFGNFISIAFLLALASLNFYSVYRARPGEEVSPQGIKAGYFRRIAQTDRPLTILVIGALFAISFDTFSLTILFSLAASTVSGWSLSVICGFSFMFGMMLVGAIDGYWVVRLLRSADQRSKGASRVIALVIGGISLLIAMAGISHYLGFEVATLHQVSSVMMGVLMTAILIGTYYATVKMHRKVARSDG